MSAPATAVERVRSARRVLTAAAVVRASAWGLAAACGLLAAAQLAMPVLSGLDRAGTWARAFGVLAGAGVMLTLLWRARRIMSRRRVALWIEERIPDLQYALVTSLEQGRTAHTSTLDLHVARHDVGGVTRDALRRAVGPALAAAALAATLLHASSRATQSARGATRPELGAPATNAGTARNRLAPLTVRVALPAYAGSSASLLDDPASVRALVGSRLTIQGPGDASGLEAAAGRTPLRAAAADRGWSIVLDMPSQPAALTLRDRGRERILVLHPRTDEPPRVVLTSPRRDSTLRIARGLQSLSASLTDDIGLGDARFEYLVTSGSGEVFTARTITTPLTSFRGAPASSLSAVLDLGSLKLEEGDVLSIRAIARDGNTVTGPGVAASDTRTFRVARAGESDSVAVDAAGPMRVDSSLMSQRMLVLMTERLVREQRSLDRAQLVRRSTEIAELEDRIRLRVHDALFPDETPTAAGGVAAPAAAPEAHLHSDADAAPRNADLLQAYNALWEAVRSLRIAEPAPALPPMRRALAALDRARLANRLYLRGAPPQIVVDLARVRMTGTDRGADSRRTPRSAADSIRVRLETRFAEALALLARRPDEAVRAITLLQVEALATAPSVGAALGEAIDAFRRGRDATLPLVRARRALSGEPTATPGLPAWSGAW